MSKNHYADIYDKELFLRLDNPGQGDCGYYAFAMGVIQLAKDHQISAPIERWKALDPTVVNDLDEMLQDNPLGSSSNKWYQLQLSMRRLVFNHIAEKCPTRYDEFLGQPPYEDFFDLVRNYSNRFFFGDLDGRLNALTKSKELRSLAEAIHSALKQIKYPDNPKVQEIARNEFIFAALVKHRQLVLNAYQSYYLESHAWATEQELCILAQSLGIGVKYYINGHPCTADLLQEPHIILNNENNRHWTLLVPKAQSVFQILPEAQAPTSSPNEMLPQVQDNPLQYEMICNDIEDQIQALNQNTELTVQERTVAIQRLNNQKTAELNAVKRYVRADFGSLLENLTPTVRFKGGSQYAESRKTPSQRSHQKNYRPLYAAYCLNSSVFGLFVSGISIAIVPELVMTTMATLAISQVSATILILASSMLLAALITYAALIIADSWTQAIASK